LVVVGYSLFDQPHEQPATINHQQNLFPPGDNHSHERERHNAVASVDQE